MPEPITGTLAGRTVTAAQVGRLMDAIGLPGLADRLGAPTMPIHAPCEYDQSAAATVGLSPLPTPDSEPCPICEADPDVMLRCPRCLGDGRRGEDCPKCGGNYVWMDDGVLFVCIYPGCRCGRLAEEK